MAFGAPLAELSVDDLTTQGTIFQIGLAPARIDLLTAITAVEFDDAWFRRAEIEVEGRRLPFLSREDLIRNKTRLGRPRDLADVADLQRTGPK